MNGFGTGADTITVSYPACALPGGICSSLTSPNQIQVVVTRAVDNTLIRMLGAGATNSVSATAIAAVLNVVAPVPIIVMHPSKSGALNGNGTTSVVITGG